MAGSNSRKEPLCVGTRKDGSPCNSYARLNGYCLHHSEQAPETGPVGPVDAPAEPDETDGGELAALVSILPSEFKERLRVDVAANYGRILELLNDGLSATREAWATCHHCHRKTPIQQADYRSRIEALRVFTTLGFGPTEAAEPDDAPDLDIVYEDLPSDDAKAEHRKRLLKAASPGLVATLKGGTK